MDNQLPTLGQLWANNVVDSLNKQSQAQSTPNVNLGMQQATQNLQKRALKKQSLADQLISTNSQQQLGNM